MNLGEWVRSKTTCGESGAGADAFGRRWWGKFWEVKEKRRKMRKEETLTIDLLHRAVLAKHTYEGLRALSGESPIRSESVQSYPEGKFGDALEDISKVMPELAKSLPSPQLAEKAYGLALNQN